MEHAVKILKQRKLLNEDFNIDGFVAMEIKFVNRKIEATKTCVFLIDGDENWTYRFQTDNPNTCICIDHGVESEYHREDFLPFFEVGLNAYLNGIPPQRLDKTVLLHIN